MAEIEIPVGGGGRVSLSQATDAQLKSFITWQTRRFDSGQVQERFAAQNERQLAEAERELERRKQAPAKGIEKVEVASLGRAIHDPAAVTAHLAKLAENFHLVGPATTVDVLPEGCGVAVTYVRVNVADCYAVGGRLALSGTDLKRIAVAAGLAWDMQSSGRLDDARDPHYCHYRAVGHVRNFDGSILTVDGEVEIDMREGSPQVEEIRAKAEIADKKREQDAKRERKPFFPGDGGTAQIREIRKFLIRHAQTKAKLRAIADLGVRRSYDQAELEKPFACARLTWTGETQDPELRRQFAQMMAVNMLGSTELLYGERLRLSTPRAQTRAKHAPPPVGTIDAEFDELFDIYGQGPGEEVA